MAFLFVLGTNVRIFPAVHIDTNISPLKRNILGYARYFPVLCCPGNIFTETRKIEVRSTRPNWIITCTIGNTLRFINDEIYRRDH